METKISAQPLKEMARGRGVDLVGVASIDRFQGAPPRYHPKRFLKKARSVVVVGSRVLRGLLHGLGNNVAYLPHSFFGQGWLSNVKVNLAVFDVARWIEDNGYLAVPIPWPDIEGRMAYLHYLEKHGGAPDSEPGDPGSPEWPGETFVSFKLAAVAAGLGEIGWNRLLLTPQFGPRNRLDVVVTDAPFEADPIYQGRLCDPEDCGYRCVKVCPAETLKRTPTDSLRIGCREFRFSAFDEVRCAWVLAGLRRETCTFAPCDSPPPPSPTAGEFLTRKEDVWGRTRVYRRYESMADMGAAFCSRCQMVCADYLEEKGKLENRFLDH